MGDNGDSRYGIHQADARNLQAKLEESFDSTHSLVDAVITSPPYADVQDYGDQEGQIGEQPYEEFLEELRSVFEQCYDVAADHATLWINTDTFRRGGRVIRPPFDLSKDLENLRNRQYCPSKECNGRLKRDRGTGILYCDEENCNEKVNTLDESWRLSDHIIWDKQRTRPWQQKGQMRNVYEHISMYTKTDDFKYNQDAVRIEDVKEFGRWWVDYPERYHPKGKLPDNIWEFPIPKQGEWGPKLNYHPSPFPVGLVERIIKLATDPGDVVLDPFAGVGSTLAVAKRLGRKPLGFEINPEFIDYYNTHVLPEIGQKQTEQQELIDKGRTLEEIIWTLRIHKYAFRLQRELITNEQFDITRSDFTAVGIHASQDKFTADVSPSATLHYIGTKRLVEDKEEFTQAQSNLVSDVRGSGDYYEVDFDVRQCAVEEWFNSVGVNVLSDDAQFYIYTDGTHYRYRETVDFEGWKQLYGSGQWKRYQSPSWCPLVSVLPIEVENPRESVDQDLDENQAILTSFTSSNFEEYE